MKSSKKILSVFLTLLVLVLSLTALFACDDDSYTVSFDSNGGTNVSNVTVAAGEKLTAPTTPTKEGYVFDGWYSEGGLWNFDTAINKDTTLVAMWKKAADADIVEITFDSAGGSAVPTLLVSRGVVFGAPEAPTRTGYRFMGWYLDGKEFDFSKTVLVLDTTLVAEWAIENYSIAYDLAGGTNASGNPTSFTVETESFSLGAPTLLGYEFLGWTYEGQETPVTEIEIAKGSTANRSYKANWQLITYSISYDYKGGTGAETPVTGYNVNTDDVAIPDPTKANYEFLGWTYEGQTEPVKALVIAKGSVGNYALVANWKATEYKINYELGENSDNSMNPESYNVESGEITLAAPVRPGYEFLGWTYEGVTEPTSTVVIAAGSVGEKAYVANWSIITYTIDYVKDPASQVCSGNELKTQFTVNDLPLTPESLFINNKCFVSWFADEGLENPIDAITECGNITLYAKFNDYTQGLTFTKKSGSYLVSGYNGEESAVYIPELYEGLPVLAIDAAAFSGNETVSEVYIPYGINAIGTEAFYNCKALTAVHMRSDCLLESIGRSAFSACSSLAEINLPASLESISEKAFYTCINLKTVSFAKDSRLTSIGVSAFENCAALETVSIPAGVSVIPNRAFFANTSLVSVSFDPNAALTSIGDEAFSACTKLETFTVPANVVSLGNSAFNKATALTKIIFAGDKLNSVGEYAFSNCDSLVTLTLPKNVTEIKAGTFSNANSLESVVFAEGSKLTSIGDNAFYNCPMLSDIALPDTIVEIGGSAFYECSNLKNVKFGSSLTTIGNYAFYNCNSLHEIKLSKAASNIGKSAFAGCNQIVALEIAEAINLTNVFNGALPETIETVVVHGGASIDAGIFSSLVNLKSITVPYVGTAPNSTDAKLNAIFGGTVPTTLTEIVVTGSYAIPEMAFQGCSSAEKIIISKDISSIGNKAFADCEKLAYIELSLVTLDSQNDDAKTLSSIFGDIPKSLKTVTITVPTNAGYAAITKGAFVGSSVETVVLDKKLTAIGDEAFRGVLTLSNIVIAEDTSLMTIGEYAFANCSQITSFNVPKSVIEIKAGAFANGKLTAINFAENSALRTIGAGAFENCAQLTSVAIPSGVTVISENLFKNSSIVTVTVSDAITAIKYGAFENCASLETVLISDGSSLNTIESRAFAGATKLTSFNVPKLVTSIGSSAFENCSSLVAISFDDESVINEIGARAFKNSALIAIALPANLSRIQEEAFINCGALVNVSFAEGSKLEAIGYSAFENCSSLYAIAIPDGIICIRNNTFYNCENLVSVSFGENSKLSIISSMAFKNCVRLASFNLPAGVSEIADLAFAQCMSLTSFIIPENSLLSEIGNQAFNDCDSIVSLTLPKTLVTLSDEAFLNCDSLKTVTFAEGSVITEIAPRAFAFCKSLESVTFPDSLLTIGERAFYSCASLKTLSFGENASLNAISSYAFAECDKLTGLKAPASLTTVGQCAFDGCDELATVEISVNCHVDAYAFRNCTKLTVKISYSEESDKALIDSWDKDWNPSGAKLEWVDITPEEAPAA